MCREFYCSKILNSCRTYCFRLFLIGTIDIESKRIFSDGTKDDANDSGVNIRLENSQSDNENDGAACKWPVFGE